MKGTHTESGLALKEAITIYGETGNPEDVEIVDQVQGRRLFTISNDGVVVKDLTISGTGWNYTDAWGCNVYGGHINMSAGVFENCIIKNGRACSHSMNGHGGGHGGNVYMSGGRLVRCRVSGGISNPQVVGQQTCEGDGIYATGGIIDSCLIADNGNGVSQTTGVGVYANGAVTVVNCTVVGNHLKDDRNGAGIYVNSAAAKIINCVMYDNGGTAAKEFGTANLDRFSHCASSVTNESCATWKIVTERDFVNYEKGKAGNLRGYRPSGHLDHHALSESGTTWEEYMSEVDLLGGPRMTGIKLDIGCIEGFEPGGTLRIR